MQHPLWHKIPLVRILIPFVCGISMSMFTHFAFWGIALASLLSVCLCFFVHYYLKRFSLRWVWGICINICIGLVGWTLHLLHDKLNDSSHFSHTKCGEYVWAKVNEEPQLKSNSYKLVAEVKVVVDSTGTEIVAHGKIMVYLSKTEPPPQYGELLRIPFRLIHPISGPQNPDEFDYQRYLGFRQIYFQVYLNLSSYSRAKEREANPIMVWVYATQHYFKSVLVRCLNSANEAGVAQALLYGYDDEIDAETMQAYANTGTLHVLAVSGMHVGIIYMILAMLFAPLLAKRKSKWVALLIILILLWVYSLLCGFSPSILRATVMFSFIILADMMEMRSSVYNTLAASAWVLLSYDPNMLANVGFQLSYLAVLGIVFFQPLITNWYIAPNWLLHQIWSIISVSLAAQLVTFPVGLLYFHQFPNVFLFSNLIIIPLTTIILYGCIVLLIISKLSWLSWLLGQALAKLILFTNELVKWVEQLPLAYVNGITVTIIQTILLYGIIISITYFLLIRSKPVFKIAILFGILFMSIVAWQFVKHTTQNRMVVYSINKHNAIQVFTGTQSLLIADSVLLSGKTKLLFHTKQHVWRSGVRLLTSVATDSIRWQRFRMGKSCVVLTGRNTPEETVVCDILLVKDEIKDVSKLRVGKAIITSAVNKYKAQQILAELKKQNIDANYVGEKGAIELSLPE